MVDGLELLLLHGLLQHLLTANGPCHKTGQFKNSNHGKQIGCLRYMIYDIPNYVGLENIHSKVNIIMKPTNSPTQGQPNPTKIRLKVAFGPLFPTEMTFRGLGLVLYRKQTSRNLLVTQSNSPQPPQCP